MSILERASFNLPDADSFSAVWLSCIRKFKADLFLNLPRSETREILNFLQSDSKLTIGEASLEKHVVAAYFEQSTLCFSRFFSSSQFSLDSLCMLSQRFAATFCRIRENQSLFGLSTTTIIRSLSLHGVKYFICSEMGCRTLSGFQLTLHKTMRQSEPYCASPFFKIAKFAAGEFHCCKCCL